jgi:hypothetical protein
MRVARRTRELPIEGQILGHLDAEGISVDVGTMQPDAPYLIVRLRREGKRTVSYVISPGAIFEGVLRAEKEAELSAALGKEGPREG